MADSFSIDMRLPVQSFEQAWHAYGIIESTVKEIDPERLAIGRWSVLASGRRWDRKRLAAIRAVVDENQLTYCRVTWWHPAGSMAWLAAFAHYETGFTDLELTAFGGKDRLKTEALVRRVDDALRRAGIFMNVGETTINSHDDDDDDDATDPEPRKPAPTAVAPAAGQGTTRWTRFWSFIGQNTVKVVTSIIAGLTVAFLLAMWGLNR